MVLLLRGGMVRHDLQPGDGRVPGQQRHQRLDHAVQSARPGRGPVSRPDQEVQRRQDRAPEPPGRDVGGHVRRRRELRQGDSHQHGHVSCYAAYQVNIYYLLTINMF